MPLAEIRTDGRNLEFVVDNTGGKLPYTAQGSFERLKEVVDQSSHLSLEEPDGVTAHLIKYSLSNGDVIEITTDGKTALLNGNLLTEPQKNAVFEAVRTKQLKVVRNSGEPIPVVPSKVVPAAQKPARKLNAGLIDGIQAQVRQHHSDIFNGTRDYDPEIENSDYQGMERADDIKDFWYWLKYGDER